MFIVLTWSLNEGGYTTLGSREVLLSTWVFQIDR